MTFGGRAVAGVDVGSTLTKVVVHNGSLLGSATGRTGADYVQSAARLVDEALARAGLDPGQLAYVVATGYGRRRVPFADREITEITCHARGVRELFPEARTIIDIGGQDAKGIKLGPGSKVVDFAMNDKCAAGTGRFLEIMAATLGLGLEELGRRGLGSSAPASVSSVCTVFAEQEVAERLAQGVALEDVLAGLHGALASRIDRMVRRLRIEPQVIVTGGGARNPGLVRALGERLGAPLLTPPDPLLTGALGAAVLAGEALGEKEAAARRSWVTSPSPGGTETDIRAADQASTASRPARRKATAFALDGQFSLPPGPLAPRPAAAVDVGALFTKAVTIEGERVSFAVCRSEGNYRAAAERALARALAIAGVTWGVPEVAATGLGGGKTGLGPTLSEITCLAAGMIRLLPGVGQVIDIGGHGTRVIRLGAGGAVRDFATTGQCAAGSARILEVIAHVLGVELDELGALSLRAQAPAAFSAGCAVFAETEAISLLSRGVAREDLVAGLHRSLAAKILAMARPGAASGSSALAGGGARDAGLVARLGAELPSVVVPPEPMVVAALGAALLAGARR